MKTTGKLWLLSILLACILMGCDKTDDTENGLIITDSSAYDYIGYGSSFGECQGYCTKKIKLTASETLLTKIGWDLDGSLPIVNQQKTTDSNLWRLLNDSIDYQEFATLDTVIGCPDCADGGVEWLEVQHQGANYKVNFEHGYPPTQIATAVDSLRAYVQRLDE